MRGFVRVARTIYGLSRSGTQVFIATHSLFLLRELEIILTELPTRTGRCRFFGLQSGKTGTEISEGDSIEDIGDISSLDEELEQSDRYLAVDASVANR